MSEQKPDRRLRLMSIVTIAIFLLLLGRLWQLQIVHGDLYATLSEGNRIRLIRIPAPRGRILDRNGIPIASSRMAYTISVIPRELDKSPESLSWLSRILGIDVKDLKKKISDSGERSFEPVRLVIDADPALITAIEERRYELPGVIVEELPVRYYPFGDLACHLLGYIGQIGPSELKELSSHGYKPGDIIGKTGIEATYEKYLHGQDGGQQVEVNSLGRPVRVLGDRNPIPGDDIVLTIDVKLQKAAEEALSQGLESLQGKQDTKHVKGGGALVVDPRNGDILAMVSKPGFDPNDFVRGISPAKWKALNNPTNPLANRITMFSYPPGSTFKIVTATAALEEGKVTINDRFVCHGRDPISGKACWILARGQSHGVQNLVDGIKNSCNIVFYELGRRVGIDLLSKWARLYGFGMPTGFNVIPRENAGLVPEREWKERTYKGSDRIWYPDETLDVAIGQGALSVTPIQLAMAYVALANGGWLYEPHVVSKVLDSTGQVVWHSKVRVNGHVPISPENRDIIINGMKAVTSPGGTAAGSFYRFPVPVAGKTGTAQAPPGPSHAWFAAFAPADNPEVVVLTFVERGVSGAAAAAPIARKILQAYFDEKAPKSPEKDLGQGGGFSQ
ncbi:MAG TPA: penicillin-binding protein 2 [Firmicutes bacterium]|nr:penicillin-binding protein 2 [Bacillota bacterium]